MAKYGTYKYGAGVKYGATQTSNLLWAIEIDWDDDGVFDGGNEASRAAGLSLERGRDRYINYNASEIQFPTVGRATITLDNTDQRYNAWNTSSPLYGYIEPGRMARIRVTDGATGVRYPVFAGVVRDIRPSGHNNERVRIEIEDGLQWLYDNPVDIDVTQSVRVDQAIGRVLDAAAWPPAWGRSLDISSDVLTYWWADGSAAQEISKLAQTGVGYFATAADGRAIYYNRSTIAGTPIMLTDGNTLNSVKLSQPWDNYRNIVRVRFNPRVRQPAGVIWRLQTVPMILPGGTLTLWGDYNYGSETRVPALNAAVSSGDYTANSAADGSGTNLTGNIVVTLTDFGTNAKLTLVNTGGTSAHITMLQVVGEAITTPDPGSVIQQAADWQTRPRTFDLDLKWQQNNYEAASIASILVGALSSLNPYPVLQVEARPDIQFIPDLYAAVQYESASLGLNSSFRVGKIAHEWLSPNGQAVRTTYRLEPYITGVDAWTFPVASFGATGAGGTTFG